MDEARTPARGAMAETFATVSDVTSVTQNANDTFGQGVVDTGPFLRQEGRSPTWNPPPRALRQDVIDRVRLELGVPAGARGDDARSVRPNRARDITKWMANRLQGIRQP
jgi:hypothetical protein